MRKAVKIPTFQNPTMANYNSHCLHKSPRGPRFWGAHKKSFL